MRKSKKKSDKKLKMENFFNILNFDLDNDSKFSIFEVVIIIFISIVFGMIVGYVLTYTRSPLGSVKSNSKLSEIISTYNSIKDNYYKEIDEDTLVNAAVSGMIGSLDDNYSNYMDSSTTDSFNESVEGSFVGIGITIMYDGEYNKIIAVDDKGPSNKILKVDDLIVKVSGKDVRGIYGDDLKKLIRGKVGTAVKIKVLRNNKYLTFSIKRTNIEIETVKSNYFDVESKRIGYLDVDVISSNTYKQFNKNLKRLENKNIDSLIIDLRDNPGGQLSQTKEILSMFFNKKTVLYQLKDKDTKKKIYSSSNETRSYPIVILVNDGSASASEIITSCFMKNYNNIKVVGTTTYGKGTVQQSHQLSTGTSIKYTVQEWLTSNGKSINEKGIKPDEELIMNSEYYSNPTYNTDNQLQKAIEILK
ncbi:MAG: S41 family peptidase [Mollicutes bacterium]|nr:S41 family peptidase [Mollicutes bacterium]